MDDGRDEEKCSQPVKNEPNPQKYDLHKSLSGQISLSQEL
jgi:hypothetical protein